MVVNGFDELFNEFGVLNQGPNMGAMLGLMLIIMSFTVGLSILLYVLESIGLYTLCTRRGLGNAWLAWIPVGNLWTLGKIADRDQENRSGKPARLRVWMLVLVLALPVAMILMFAVGFIMGSFAALSGNDGGAALGLILVLVLCYLLLLGITITLQVMTYVSYYRLFRSCRSDLAPVFLVLGIFFSFLLPIFVFALRRKDDLPAPQPVVEPVE